ncbi:RNA polymerase sigma factor [Cytobacillus sp. Hz8]|uniref:RNA polymerase sigma factor n=1 Tax=Cytobacillus sp. Hz8 TaxID=3347168 RepID=UPI0035DBC777
MSEIAKAEISAWYDEYSKAVLSFILIIVQDYQQAEDLTHDTFVKAYLNHSSFQKQCSEKTWLFTIAHNVTIDYIKKRKPLVQMKEAFFAKRDMNPLPEEILQIKEESYELFKAIGEMKTSYKKVMILRKIQGFSIEETANILHWSESKVKSTLHRAVPFLKKQLIKEGYLYESTI